ncbi:hypothetical protein BpHYR1_041924 [Brachionus plicatilis]|uniref:Uncharacterized protein n=1 Tax=Brachionus plicatilis TaxID=10195 RepID=A0A3M7SJ64_BRAPC|nr:hypothetical protein BpHYR1_041924 [Brachionus plicatilis]
MFFYFVEVENIIEFLVKKFEKQKKEIKNYSQSFSTSITLNVKWKYLKKKDKDTEIKNPITGFTIEFIKEFKAYCVAKCCDHVNNF